MIPSITVVMERIRLFAAGTVALSLLLGSVTLGVVLVPSLSPCHDFTATSPQIAFNITYNSSTESLRVIHDGGDRLTEKNTNSLTIRVRPEGSEEYSTRYILASDSKGGYPVDDTDEWVFTEASINDRPLSNHDIIRVVWSGPDDIPSYCPNYQEEKTTLAKLVIGEKE